MALSTVLEEFVNVITWRVDDRQLARAQHRIESTLNKMEQAGKKLTAFVTLPIVGIGAAMVKTASDATEIENKFTSVFGKMTQEATQFSDKLSQETGRSIIDIKDSLSAYQSQFVGLGFGAKEATEMSKKMARLAIDFGSFHNLSDAESMQRFIAAMSGSGEVLDRFGVNIKQSNLELKLQQMGLADSVRNATEAQKAMARLAIIEETMGKQGAVGDANKTLGEFANQMRVVKSNVKDLFAEFGKIVIPILNTLIKKYLNPMLKFFKNMSSPMKKIIIIFALLAAALGPIMIALPFIVSVGTTVLTFFGVLTTTVTTAGVAVTGFNIAVAAIPILVALAIGALASLINEVYTWVKGGNSLIGELLGPWKAFSKYLAEEFGINALKDFRKELIDFFNLGLPHAIKTTIFFIEEVFMSMKKLGASLSNFVRGKGFRADIGQKLTTENTVPASASAVGGKNLNTNISQTNKINVNVTVPEGTSQSAATSIVSDGVANALNPNGYNAALVATAGMG